MLSFALVCLDDWMRINLLTLCITVFFSPNWRKRPRMCRTLIQALIFWIQEGYTPRYNEIRIVKMFPHFSVTYNLLPGNIADDECVWSLKMVQAILVHWLFPGKFSRYAKHKVSAIWIVKITCGGEIIIMRFSIFIIICLLNPQFCYY